MAKTRITERREPVPVVPPPRLHCVAPQLVMQHPEDKWEMIQVTRDSAVMDVPRPNGHCLVPYRNGMLLCSDHYVLLEDKISKETIEPYKLISFAEFSKHVMQEHVFRRNGKIYNIYTSCERSLMHVKKGERIFVQKKKVPLPLSSVKPFISADVIGLVIPFLYGLDLINMAETCVYLWNLIVSNERGKQTIGVSSTVRGFRDLAKKFRVADPCNESHLQLMRNKFVKEYQQDESVAAAVPANVESKTDESNELGCNDDTLKKRKRSEGEEDREEPDVRRGIEESEEERSEREKTEEEARYPWLSVMRRQLSSSRSPPTATSVSLPFDFLECHRLHDGVAVGDSYFLFPLHEITQYTSSEYVHLCSGMGTGYSSLIFIGMECEEHDYLVMNIDQSDPCYGYVYGYDDYNDQLFGRYSFSFEDLIFSLWNSRNNLSNFKNHWVGQCMVPRIKWII